MILQTNFKKKYLFGLCPRRPFFNYIIRKTGCFFLLFPFFSFAQVDSNFTNSSQRDLNKRLRHTVYATTAIYGGSLVALNELWYKNNPRTAFHFFNDNAEWQQIDKVGHFFSTYQISYLSSKLLKNTGLSDSKSAFWGSVAGATILLPVEIFDGFSASYGASWGDAIADVAGAAFFYGQQAYWHEIRLKPKFSFHNTSFAPQRPNVLGKNLQEQILKDYNGQTYWLSIQIHAFLKEENKFPKWLNVAVGYGAENMLFSKKEDNLPLGLKTYRQYYLALDVDLAAIPTRKKWLKTILEAVNIIHLPLPSLEYNKMKGFVFHPIYY